MLTPFAVPWRLKVARRWRFVMDDDPLEPKPPVGVTRGLIRHRDKWHVGSIWLNRDTDYEFEDPETGERHPSPHPRDVALAVPPTLEGRA